MPTVDSMGSLVARILHGIEDGSLAVGFNEPFRRGSASGYVTVVEDTEEQDNLLLRVALSIMRAPERGAADLYRRLLELNQGLQGRAAFSIDKDDVVWLTAGRPLEDLDPGEVLDLVLWTAEKADSFDDILIGEFGHDHRL
jgi:hypothetical protein